MDFQLVALTVNEEGREVAFIPSGDVDPNHALDWAYVYPSGQFRRIYRPEGWEIAEMISQEPAFPFVKKEAEL